VVSKSSSTPSAARLPQVSSCLQGKRISQRPWLRGSLPFPGVLHVNERAVVFGTFPSALSGLSSLLSFFPAMRTAHTPLTFSVAPISPSIRLLRPTQVFPIPTLVLATLRIVPFLRAEHLHGTHLNYFFTTPTCGVEPPALFRSVDAEFFRRYGRRNFAEIISLCHICRYRKFASDIP